MNLDLDMLVADWPNPDNAISVRHFPGVDGRDVLQLRVDLGVLQMFIEGRPDGARFRGMPSVLDFIRHDLRVRGDVHDDVWQELQRELGQFNYRRIGLGALAEQATLAGDQELARLHLRRGLRDIDHCLIIIRTLEEHRTGGAGSAAASIPLLIFNRARLLARLLELEGRFDEAIEEAQAGADALELVLGRYDLESETDESAGVGFLLDMANRLRREHRVRRTLREQLDDALESEDFELAARLRDRLGSRRRAWGGNPYFRGDASAADSWA